MKTLEEIKEAVGADLFRKWERQAEKELAETAYPYRSSEARHAYIYGEVLRRFQTYTNALQSHNRVVDMVSHTPLVEGDSP